jgi:acyl dehydratase
MTSRLRFEDLPVGRRFQSERRTIDTAAIKAFAADFDPQPFHLDEAAAAAGFFGALTASGWHTAALSMRLIIGALPIAGGVIGAGGDLAWPRSVRPGDTLSVAIEVVEARLMRSRPGFGLVTIRATTVNQANEPVQVLTARLVVPSREAT